MSDFRSMDSDVLEARMRVLVGRGRQAEVDFLLHLMEFDRRRGYEALGYVRLWDYCRKELHFLEGASWRRMHAIATLRRFPAAEEYLRDGRLSMTALVLLEEALTPDNAVEMFEKATHRSKKEIEYLVACVRAPVTLGKASIRKKVAPLGRAGRGTPLQDPADGGAVVVPSAVDFAAVPAAASATLGAAAVPAAAGSGSARTAVVTTGDLAGVVGRNVETASERTFETMFDGMAEGTVEATFEGRLEETVEAGKKVRPSRTGSVEVLSGDCFQVRMTVTKEFVDALEQVQKILGHTISRTDIAGALKAGLDVILARDAKKKTPQPRKPPAKEAQPRKAEPTATPPKTGSANMPRPTEPAGADETRPTEPAGSDEAGAIRLEGARRRAEFDERPFFPAFGAARREHIPVEVSRAVWARDGGCCVWVMASGERCGADEEAQIDHEIPVAFGGGPTVGNLRILCRGHNLLHARQCFGDAFMGRFRGVAPERFPARSAE